MSDGVLVKWIKNTSSTWIRCDALERNGLWAGWQYIYAFPSVRIREAEAQRLISLGCLINEPDEVGANPPSQ